MRRRAICGVLVPGSLASAREFKEDTPPDKEAWFLDVKKVRENLSCIAIEDCPCEFRDDFLRR
jgi:hypothetical protein